MGQLLVTHLLYTVRDPFALLVNQVSKLFIHTLLFGFFFVKPKLSISEKNLGRALMGETHSNTGQQLVTHVLHKVQEYTALHNSPVSETVFTLFSMFFWCSRS